MTGAGIHFVVLAGRANLVVDVASEGRSGPLSAEGDPVLWSFTSHGLRLLPAFLGQSVPEADDLLVAAGHGSVALTTTNEVDVLAVDDDEVPDTWFDAAEEHEGVVVLMGRDLSLAGLSSEQEVGQRLDAAAKDGRVLGATVVFD